MPKSRDPSFQRRLAVALAMILVFVLNPRAAFAADRAVQVSGQTVTAGPLRLQVLSPTLLRLEYAADNHFEDRPTFNAVDRAPGRTPFSATAEHGQLVVRTSAVTLRYTLGSGPVTATGTTLELTVAGKRTVAHPAFGAATAGAGQLGGWYRGLDYYPGQAGPVDQIHLNPGVLDQGGWFLLDDTATAVRTADGWVAARPAHTGAY